MIYLIEKGWIDPMENRKADGYDPYAYANTEEEAKKFCESKGYWSAGDCWSIGIQPWNYPDKIMPKYRYKALKHLKE